MCRPGDADRILEGTEVADVVELQQGSVWEPISDQWSEAGRIRAGFVLAHRHRDRQLDPAQPVAAQGEVSAERCCF